jgi:hypothetical protein
VRIDREAANKVADFAQTVEEPLLAQVDSEQKTDRQSCEQSQAFKDGSTSTTSRSFKLSGKTV